MILGDTCAESAAMEQAHVRSVRHAFLFMRMNKSFPTKGTPVSLTSAAGIQMTSDEGFYDEAGRWWPSNAEWCDRCQGMGTEECLCAGDFCCCGWGDNLECRRCHGEGYYILTDKMKAEREEIAKWWNGLMENATRRQAPGSGTPEVVDKPGEGD